MFVLPTVLCENYEGKIANSELEKVWTEHYFQSMQGWDSTAVRSEHTNNMLGGQGFPSQVPNWKWVGEPDQGFPGLAGNHFQGHELVCQTNAEEPQDECREYLMMTMSSLNML